MPWKETSPVEERLRFVARLLEGEPMAAVCREFGISRKTGYKIFDRYREHGQEALNDRSRQAVIILGTVGEPKRALGIETRGPERGRITSIVKPLGSSSGGFSMLLIVWSGLRES